MILVTGAPGQDALILTKLSCSLGEEVVATARTISQKKRSEQMLPDCRWEVLDIQNTDSCSQVIRRIKPTTVFNFAGISSVADSWSNPSLIQSINVNGALNLLWAIATSLSTLVREFIDHSDIALNPQQRDEAHGVWLRTLSSKEQ